MKEYNSKEVALPRENKQVLHTSCDISYTKVSLTTSLKTDFHRKWLSFYWKRMITQYPRWFLQLRLNRIITRCVELYCGFAMWTELPPLVEDTAFIVKAKTAFLPRNKQIPHIKLSVRQTMYGTLYSKLQCFCHYCIILYFVYDMSIHT